MTATHCLGAIALLAIGGCTLDLSLKHRCATTKDCSPGRACVRNVCEAPTPGPQPNYMFVTSQKYPPRFQPLENADAKCNDAAAAGGLPGNYRAWLSTAAVYARDRLAGARGWVRRDGTPFADTVDDLVAGKIFNPPLLDEFGDEVRSDLDWVATGTDATGYNSPGATCNEWANDQVASLLYGVTVATTDAWTALGTTQCLPMHLYCFGVDQMFTVSPVAMAGRAAFLLDAQFNPVGGRDGADSACAGEATAAGIPGMFWALLPRDDEWAASRFPDMDVPWVRLDGVPIAATGADLFNGVLLSPLNVTSKRRYIGLNDYVFVGAMSPFMFPASSDCGNWTDPNGSGAIGMPNYVSASWFYANLAGCIPGSHVYCLQH